MAMEKEELQHWLSTLPAKTLVAVDEGGLTLAAVGTEYYIEIGGADEEETEEEETPDMTCDQCEALMINSMYCHETGCPNKGKVKIDGEWVTPDDEPDEEEEEEDDYAKEDVDLDMSCDQCQATMINGVYCHETGCPNMSKEKIDGEWVTPDEDDEDEDEDEEVSFEMNEIEALSARIFDADMWDDELERPSEAQCNAIAKLLINWRTT